MSIEKASFLLFLLFSHPVMKLPPLGIKGEWTQFISKGGTVRTFFKIDVCKSD